MAARIRQARPLGTYAPGPCRPPAGVQCCPAIATENGAGHCTVRNHLRPSFRLLPASIFRIRRRKRSEEQSAPRRTEGRHRLQSTRRTGFCYSRAYRRLHFLSGCGRAGYELLDPLA
jgi:hypothetical protein